VSRPELTRQQVHQRLHDSYATLISATTGLSEADLLAMQITPEWNALDLLRHLSVWNELSIQALANWQGKQNVVLSHDRLDAFNAETVAARSQTSLNEVLSLILAAYGQYAATLLNCTDAELQERAVAPWDQEVNRVELIFGILYHDLAHFQEIRQVREQEAT
jgi:hypothetical protein